MTDLDLLLQTTATFGLAMLAYVSWNTIKPRGRHRGPRKLRGHLF